MQFYTSEIVSENLARTPEGYLVCSNVPVARIGTMLYAASEVPSVTADADGLIRIERTSDVVFAQATMQSFNAKPITLQHPTEDVGPDNWQQLARGIAQNLRRGSGIQDDLLLADLLITEQKAIDSILSNRIREISCGYDAKYEEIAPGKGRQIAIVGNHIALVDKGRCGSRCAIRDEDNMKKKTWKDRLLKAFHARDESEFNKLVVATGDEETETEEEEKKKKKDEEEEDKTSDALPKILTALDQINQRLSKLETRDAEEEEEEEEKKKKKDEEDSKTGDTAALVAEVQDVNSRVEIIAPGLKLATHDAAASVNSTRDALCTLTRKALETAYTTAKGKDAIVPFMAGFRDFDSMTCDAARTALIGASEILKRTNNLGSASTTFDAAKNAANVRDRIAEINRINHEFWANRKQ